MKTLIAIVQASLLLLAACTPEKGIEIHDAWMRPTAQGENGAVYFVIHNHSSASDELIGGSSVDAAAVEIHQSIITSGDVAQMQEVALVLVEGFSEVEFSPGGYHLMLVDLARDVQSGDEIEVTLRFRESRDLTVHVHVGEAGAPGAGHEGH